MKRIAPVIVGLALLLPSAAFASGSSTCQSYSPQLCSSVASGNTTSATAQNTLPFTGLDVVLLAAGGGTLLGAGLIVRRFSGGARE